MQCNAEAMNAASGINPLMEVPNFPPYDVVTPEHVAPGMLAVLAELHVAVDELEKNIVPTWQGLVDPLERIGDRHSRTWGIVSHLKGVRDSDALRAAVEAVQPENVKLGLRLSQSKPLYEGFKALKEGTEWATLSPGQQRVVENELRDFVLG
eukprot:CAMPEP_0119102684 /NCGR_PEP_ID=MMETSP1180-20130426/1344_1 /TAXON_ID=3052 ORGANISM="Chlamydomonas cf sp, Strain CCMP681" /NCGR_SAMPLE_ID=MMETSP1180 /ASSEMBLY_ACC=CAM_ASM_000741 /LENGTH=151 /DNA_ID=CAMNT_0007087011 /DNA_START=189 /DNA_END=641 /DNA_ORIENTATION=+